MVHRQATLALSILLCSHLIISCLSRKNPEAGRPEQQPHTIGEIELVQPDQQFVLIRCEPAPSIAPGTSLWARAADGGLAELRLSPERKGYYYTADIIKGIPKRGEPVELRGTDIKAP
jgi:hypothetical protein